MTARPVQSGRTPFAHAADFAILLTIALLLRVSTFGDSNLFVDEAFYFSVGQAMHDGAVPYVDIWDRKPLGLFIIYWAIAGISHNVLAYQIVATLFAAATAWVIARIAQPWTGRLGGLMGATAYLVYLNPLLGFGGQAPVFYNLFVALAAWCVMLETPGYRRGQIGWRSNAAMLLCGVAITCKQTAVAEGVFLGLWAVYHLWRSGISMPRLALPLLRLAALGAAPMLAIGLWYWANDYWSPFWRAMITSNLVRHPIDHSAVSHNLIVIAQKAGILALVTLIVFLWARRNAAFSQDQRFLIGWLAAALVGFALVPRLIDHYALPVLVPVCLICAAAFNRQPVRLALFVATILPGLAVAKPWDFERHRISRHSTETIARFLRDHPGNGSLLLYDGPPCSMRCPVSSR